MRLHWPWLSPTRTPGPPLSKGDVGDSVFLHPLKARSEPGAVTGGSTDLPCRRAGCTRRPRGASVPRPKPRTSARRARRSGRLADGKAFGCPGGGDHLPRVP